MNITYDKYLKQVKALLVWLKFIKPETILSQNDWRHFYERKLSSFQAVKEDMHLNLKSTEVRWAQVADILQKL